MIIIITKIKTAQQTNKQRTNNKNKKINNVYKAATMRDDTQRLNKIINNG